MSALARALAVCLLLVPDELASTLSEKRDVVAHDCGIYFRVCHPELDDEVLCSWMELEQSMSLADYRSSLRQFLS